MISSIRHQARYNSMELGLILGRNLEKPEIRQNLDVFQAFPGFPGFPGHLATLFITSVTNSRKML